MEIGKRTEATDNELQLPESVIQHIQSFLSGKEAASTVVLAKSWYNSWLTRPNLDFDDRYFRGRNSDAQNHEMFLNFLKESMERYEELKLNIESFRLRMNVRDIDASSSASGFIVKAVKMCASGFDVEYHPPLSEFPLPKELFESKDLVRLSVLGCRILLGEVMCLRLTSLCLSKVRMEEAMIRNIMETCLMLENLSLSDCEGFKKVNVTKLAGLRKFTVTSHVTKPMLSWSPLVEFVNKSVASLADDKINVSQFWKLNNLVLERVRLGQMVFTDFLSKFPYLEDLKVHYCNGCVKFDLSSPSLKYISLADTEKLWIQLVDVPNIRKFKFSGSTIPFLECNTTSKEWESDIRLTVWNTLGASGFLEMSNFLSNLSSSKISLAIDLLSKRVEFVPDVHNFPKPVVENLTLIVHSSNSVSALLDGLIWSFQPKVVNHQLIRMFEKCQNTKCKLLHPAICKASNEALRLLYEKLTNFENSESCTPTEKLIGWHEFKEVNAEYFEDVLKEWRPLPRKSLLPVKDVQIRFHLRWGESSKLCDSGS
ncbi:putative F-box/LRR-repeat protein At3g59230 [Andrographis paniculata]|uniref:putative F-box/LRR-repeat protein At3g59230 n=1 Tax=Andrographis paniculata TaxID=175694 RepID=UPI0021E7E873|nr:putative F-box/LRR-repeat protein At3g59230 [Andrographis paniculata]